MAPSSKTTTGASAPSASVISAITSRVRLTAFDPEHVFLATVSADNRLRVVNASSAALVFEYQARDHLTNAVTAVAWGSFKTTTTTTNNKRKNADAAAAASTSTATTRVIALGFANGSVVVVNAAKGTVQAEFTSAHTSAVRGVAVLSNESGLVYSCSDDGRVIEWDLLTSTQKSQWVAEKKGVHALALDAAKGYLVTGKHQIKVWELESKKLLYKFVGHASAISGLRIVNDLVLSFAEQERFISLWDLSGASATDINLPSGSFVVDTQPIQLEVFPASVSSSSADKTQMLNAIAISEDGLVNAWIAQGKAQGTTPKKPSAVAKSAVSPQFALHFVVESSSAQTIPVLAATFSHSAAGLSILIARGASQKPTFETLNLNQAEPFQGTQQLPRAAEGGILLQAQQTSKSAASSNMDGVTVVATGGRALETPMMPPNEELSLGERVYKSQLAAAAENIAKAAAATAAANNTPLPPNTPAIPPPPGVVKRGVGKVPKYPEPAKIEFPAGIPKAVSLCSMLSQALTTDDEALLESCLAIQEMPIVQGTVQRVSTHLVVQLLQTIVHLMTRTPGRGVALSLWLRTVLANHAAYLMTMPHLIKNLGPLYQMIDDRLGVFKRLLQLSGRLDLISQQIAIRQARRKQLEALQANISTVVYDDGDLIEVYKGGKKKDDKKAPVPPPSAKERTKAALLEMSLASKNKMGMLGPIEDPAALMIKQIMEGGLEDDDEITAAALGGSKNAVPYNIDDEEDDEGDDDTNDFISPTYGLFAPAMEEAEAREAEELSLLNGQKKVYDQPMLEDDDGLEAVLEVSLPSQLIAINEKHQKREEERLKRNKASTPTTPVYKKGSIAAAADAAAAAAKSGKKSAPPTPAAPVAPISPPAPALVEEDADAMVITNTPATRSRQKTAAASSSTATATTPAKASKRKQAA